MLLELESESVLESELLSKSELLLKLESDPWSEKEL